MEGYNEMTDNITADTILDCGHVPTFPRSELTTGYGTNPTTGKRSCFECCNKDEVESLKTASHYVAYISSDRMRLTTWTGDTLTRITHLESNWHNIGGKLYRFRAVDVHGQHWYGTSPGPGMYARMRKNVAKVRR